MYNVGQGIFGKLQFTDGTNPDYERAYLIVDVLEDKIGVLNVSSAIGKGHKLFFPTNRYINNHFPPFPMKTFVKLDSLVYVSINELQSMSILANGQILDSAEIAAILKELQNMQKP